MVTSLSLLIGGKRIGAGTPNDTRSAPPFLNVSLSVGGRGTVHRWHRGIQGSRRSALTHAALSTVRPRRVSWSTGPSNKGVWYIRCGKRVVTPSASCRRYASFAARAVRSVLMCGLAMVSRQYATTLTSVRARCNLVVGPKCTCRRRKETSLTTARFWERGAKKFYDFRKGYGGPFLPKYPS